MEKTKTVHVNVPESTVEMFDNLYNAARTRFIRNAMKLAIDDRKFFDRVFFKDLINDSNSNYSR